MGFRCAGFVIITFLRTSLHAFPSCYVFLPCIITAFSRSPRCSHIHLQGYVSFLPMRLDGIYNRIPPTAWVKSRGENVAEGYLRFGFLGG